MGKIIVILVICGAGGYAYKSGYFTRLVERAQESAATHLLPSEPPQIPASQRMQFEERMRKQREDADRAMAEAGARIAAGPQQSLSEQCALARQNVQQMQNWMRKGGSVTETDLQSLKSRKLSENQTFDELSRHRLFIEQNCR